jgi:hypothetical protein
MSHTPAASLFAAVFIALWVGHYAAPYLPAGRSALARGSALVLCAGLALALLRDVLGVPLPGTAAIVGLVVLGAAYGWADREETPAWLWMIRQPWQIGWTFVVALGVTAAA